MLSPCSWESPSVDQRASGNLLLLSSSELNLYSMKTRDAGPASSSLSLSGLGTLHQLPGQPSSLSIGWKKKTAGHALAPLRLSLCSLPRLRRPRSDTRILRRIIAHHQHHYRGLRSPWFLLTPPSIVAHDAWWRTVSDPSFNGISTGPPPRRLCWSAYLHISCDHCIWWVHCMQRCLEWTTASEQGCQAGIQKARMRTYHKDVVHQ